MALNLKKIDLYNSFLLVVTGVLQWIATPVFFKTLEEPSFWFFNGGITLVLLGCLNIFRIKYGDGSPPGVHIHRAVLAKNKNIYQPIHGGGGYSPN